jgi:cell division septation protein DedD
MATLTRNLSKWLLVSGGALIVAGLIIALAVGTSSPTGVSAQATPARTATPAAAPAKTATPAAPAKTATPAAAPGALPANGDSVTFPALAIALAGAGLVGFGLFARYAKGKSKA